MVRCGMHYLQGPTAAETVHLREVARRVPVSSLCRAPVNRAKAEYAGITFGILVAGKSTIPA